MGREKGRKLNTCSFIQRMSTKCLLYAKHGSRCWDMGEHDKQTSCTARLMAGGQHEHHKYTNRKEIRKDTKPGGEGV